MSKTNTEPKKYRLLKDLPDALIDTLFTYNKEDETYDYTDKFGKPAWHGKVTVEQSPEWFSEILPEKENEGEFVWTDELVMEFCYQNGTSYVGPDNSIRTHISEGIPQFKQSKTKSTPPSSNAEKEQGRDWEIVSYTNDIETFKTIYNKGNVFDDGFKRNFQNPFYWLDNFKGYKIHSVLRKSDNTTFSIGDEVKTKAWSCSISRFEVSGDNMVVWGKSGGYCYLNENLKKHSPRPSPQDKERIEVENISGAVWHKSKPNMIMCSLKDGQVYDEEKFPAIKSAIEQVLNDEAEKHIVRIDFSLWDSWQKSVDILRSVLIPKGVKPDHNLHYNFTQSDLDRARELAYNAARGISATFENPNSNIFRYSTFEDYKKTLNP